MDATPVPVSAAEKLSQLRKNLVEAENVALPTKISSLLLENEALKHELSKALKKSKKTAKKLKKAKRAFLWLAVFLYERLSGIEQLFNYDWEYTKLMIQSGEIEKYTGANGSLLFPSADALNEHGERYDKRWAAINALGNDWAISGEIIRDLCQKAGKKMYEKYTSKRNKRLN